MTITSTNEHEINQYVHLFSQLGANGNPWQPSEQSRILSQIYRTYRDRFVEFSKLVCGKTYLIIDGVTVYQGNYGRYFERGSLATFGEIEQGNHRSVEIMGSAFRVTSDGSFANQSSTWSQYRTTAIGHVIDQVGGVSAVELSDAIKLITFMITPPGQRTKHDTTI